MRTEDCEFDQDDYFNLEAKRKTAGSEIFEILIQCLPQDFLSNIPDESLLDALSYELLRMYVASQAEYHFQDNRYHGDDPSKWLERLTSDPILQKSDNEVSIPKDIQKAFSQKHLKFLVGLADAGNFSESFKSNLVDFSQMARNSEYRIRREPYSGNIDRDPKQYRSIPYWVCPPRKIRGVLFFYRWCLLLAHSHGFFRAESLNLYDQMRTNFFAKFVSNKSKTVQSKRDRNFYSALYSVGVDTENSRSVEKRMSEMSIPWAIEFMHLDYVGLLKWDILGKNKKENFLSNFVCHVLGAHILESRLVKEWTTRSDAWSDQLKRKGKIVPILRSVVGSELLEQPVKVGSQYHSFSYLLDFEPRYPKDRHLVVHDVSELCSNLF